jgi:hypothetical protein
MGKFVQILLQPLNDMNTDGNLVIFHFGVEGWIEEYRSDSKHFQQGYRIVSQKNCDNIITQIVELMPDGWAPSKIYKQDIGFIKEVIDGEYTSFRESLVGCWNRRIIDINTEEILEEMRERSETPAMPQVQQRRQEQQPQKKWQQKQHSPQKQSQTSLLGAHPSHHTLSPQRTHRHHNNQLLIALSPLPNQQTSTRR